MVDQHKPELIPVQFKLEHTQKNLPEKEYSGAFKNSKLFPKRQLQMEHS
jgi:hypothetical protein